MKVCDIDNRGQRCFIVSLNDVIEGGTKQVGPDGKPQDVIIKPGEEATVTQECAKKLSGWKGEIKILKTYDRKE